MADTPFRPVIRCQADLEDAWRHLMQPLSFGAHAIWLMLITPGGVPVPELVEIAETAEVPPAAERDALTHFLRLLADDVAPPGSTLGFLLTRPGRARVTGADRAWARLLYDAAREARASCETVHLAADDDIRALPLDELEVPARAEPA